MSWNLAIGHAMDYWEDFLPDLTTICITDPTKLGESPDKGLDPNALFDEPRSIDSSEFSDSSEEANGPNWTPEDDTSLLEEVQKNNFEWETIAKQFPCSSARALKKRWSQLNQKNKQKREWTADEDSLISKLYSTHGGNWKKISTYFSGISACNIKNRFYGSIKKKALATEKNEDNKKDKIKEIENKPLEELSAEEKRIKLENLYYKMLEIENYIKSAKSKIQELVSKTPAK